MPISVLLRGIQNSIEERYNTTFQTEMQKVRIFFKALMQPLMVLSALSSVVFPLMPFYICVNRYFSYKIQVQRN
jgi:hypothetical protein